MFRNSTVNIMKITIITFPLYSLMHENSVFRGIQRALVEFKKQILKRKHCRNKIMLKIFKISHPLKKFCKYCFSFFLRFFSSAILNLKIAISNWVLWKKFLMSIREDSRLWFLSIVFTCTYIYLVQKPTI